RSSSSTRGGSSSAARMTSSSRRPAATRPCSTCRRRAIAEPTCNRPVGCESWSLMGIVCWVLCDFALASASFQQGPLVTHMIRNATLAVLLAASARITYADPDPTEASREAQARAYFERGVAHVKAHHYLEARAEFAAGYELSHRPTFLFNMAECSRLDG